MAPGPAAKIMTKPAKARIQAVAVVEVIAAILATACFGFFLAMFLDNYFDLTASRKENAALREVVDAIEQNPARAESDTRDFEPSESNKSSVEGIESRLQ